MNQSYTALLTVVVCLLIGGLFAGTTTQAATVITDSVEYDLGSKVGIRGSNFQSGELVNLVITYPDGSPLPNEVESAWSVVADGIGDISDDGRSSMGDPDGSTLDGFLTDWLMANEIDPGDTLLLSATGEISGATATTEFVAKTYVIHHLKNGTATVSPAWSIGNINSSNSCYAEASNVPYRFFVSNLAPGSTHSFKIVFEATKGGIHGLDYLSEFDLSEAGPIATIGGECSSVDKPAPADCFAPVPVCPLPDPRLVSSYVSMPPPEIADILNPLFALDGPGSLYGYNVSNVSLSPYSFEGTSSDRLLAIYVTFEVVSWGSVGFYWGGHLAEGAVDTWGSGLGAGAISGASYHMAAGEVDGSGGMSNMSVQDPLLCTPPDLSMTCSSGDFCLGSTHTCSVPAGAASYDWTVSGGTIVSGQGTETVTYTVTGTVGSQITISVDACSSIGGCPSNPCCGQSSSQFTIVDCCTIDIVCPADVALECDQSTDPGNTGIATYTAAGSCPTPITVSYTDTETVGACPQERIISRVWSVFDGASQLRDQCTQTITIDDTTPPTLSGTPADATVECDAIPAPASVTADDNCDGVTLDYAQTETVGACANEKTITRTWTATDACGNATVWVQTITVVDNTPPVVTCPADLSVQCAGDVPTPNTSLVSATDNCDLSPVLAFVSDVSDGLSCPETITRTYKATDACGNEGFGTRTITIDDTTPPTLSGAPADVTVECDAIPAPASVTADDNCVGVTLDYAQTETAGACAHEKTITRTWTATDACGNETVWVQTITVVDTTPPTITSCPGTVTVQCAADVPAPDPGLVTAVDNCNPGPGVSFVSDVSDGLTCPETITRTYRATDVCGNSSYCTQTIIIDDTAPPVITCPADQTVYCGQSTAPSNTGTATATDNCSAPGAVVITYTDVVGSGSITRTWTATDECGNQADCVQTIAIGSDTVPPTLTCPAAVTVACLADIPSPDPAGIVTSDDCDPDPTVSFQGDVQSGSTCPITVTRTYRSTDATGNYAECSQIITVDDDTPPTLSGTPADVTVECDAVPAPAPVTADDNCSGVTLNFEQTETAGACAHEKTITRTWTATDACGNEAAWVQTITVVDTTPPTITSCPGPVTVQCAADVPAPDVLLVSAADNCNPVGPTITHVSDVSDGLSCPETVTRTYRATDVCGNSSYCTQTIIIDDTTPPAITCPADLTVFCGESTDPSHTGTATASDNCTATGGIVVGYSDVTGSGTITRTWTATDECGNLADCDQIITFGDDVTPPQITCPADITVDCLADVPAADPGGVTATDNCDPDPVETFVGDVPSGGSCPLTITRTYRATDAGGNYAECSQVITVDDQTPPTLSGCPTDLTVECDAIPAPASVTADDNCTGVVLDFAQTETAGACAHEKTLTRTWTATDACGNQTQCVQIIEVVDTTPPVITASPGPVSVQCTGDVPAPDVLLVSATDNCNPGPTIAFVGDVSDGLTCPETITRTYRATDVCGNSSYCTQIITVDDTTPPSITCPADFSVDCMTDVPAYDIGAVTASDNCDPAPVVAFVSDVVNGTGCPLTIIRTYSATDFCGNNATCSQTITVNDQTPPVITCPAPITVECPGDVPAQDPGLVAVYDNCDPDPDVVWVSDDPTGSCPTIITRLYKATDDCGNEAFCQQVITVDDQTPPQLHGCPANATIECGAVPAPDAVTATDNCSGVTLDFAETTVPGACDLEYIVTRTWTATDLCGNEAECVQTITVTDNTAPVVECPADVTVGCMSEVPAIDVGAVTVTDACDPAPTVYFVDDVVTGDCPLYIARTYRAVDACGNEAFCSQTITVDDQEPPVLSGCAADVTVGCDVPVPSPVTPSVSDNCGGGTLDFEETSTPGGCPQEQVITRVWTATDQCGNQASCTQVITVVDDTPPELTCPAGITYECWSDVPNPDPNLVTVTDNCDPAPLVAWDHDNLIGGACPSVLERTYRATDACGNTNTCIQTFTLDDQTPPFFTTAPANQSLTRCLPTEICLPVAAADNCDGNVWLTVESGPGAIAAGNQWCYTPTGSGTFEVILRATDTCGLFTDHTFQVEIDLNTPPQITNCPDNSTVRWGETFTVDIDATDPDEGQTLSFALCDGGPDGMTINSGTGLIQWPTTAENICDPVICVEVTDDCGTADTCQFDICVSNEPPQITCPGDMTICHGYPFATQVTMVDPQPGPFAFFHLVSGPEGLTVDPNDGTVSWPEPAPGSWEVCVEATDAAPICDPCSPANADTCCFTVNVVALDIVIEKVHDQIQGQFTDVSVDFLHQGSNWPIAGYDFLIQYDASALGFRMAQPGRFLDDCEWEYFTYRFGASGNCGVGACPSGVLRIVAIAETTGGDMADHPDCFTNDGIADPGPNASTSTQLAILNFLVSNDRTVECQYLPIRFVWYDCGDNGLSNVRGDTLYISNMVYDYRLAQVDPEIIDWHDITGLDNTFPTVTGAPSPACDISDKFELVRCANFYNGGVDVICADDIDDPGDINLNGIAYEIADAVMLTNYFISGLAAFSDCTGLVDDELDECQMRREGAIAASDANRDGVPLSVADLVFVIRVVVGDCLPYAKETPAVVNTSYSVDDGVVTVANDVAISGAALVVRGEVYPELLVEGMNLQYAFDGENTHIVVTPKHDAPTLAAFRGAFLAGIDRELISLDMATPDGATVVAKNVPIRYRLSQNYPNPFNPVTTIEFALPEPTGYSLTVYNIAGQMVGRHEGRADAPGVFRFEWDGSQHASGVYFYRLDAGGFTLARKMLMLK